MYDTNWSKIRFEKTASLTFGHTKRYVGHFFLHVNMKLFWHLHVLSHSKICYLPKEVESLRGKNEKPDTLITQSPILLKNSSSNFWIPLLKCINIHQLCKITLGKKHNLIKILFQLTFSERCISIFWGK